MKTIAELVDGDHVYGQFLVTNVTKGVTTGSKNYLTITFQDATGTMDGKRWDYAPEDPEIFVPGNIVNLEAEVISYKDHLQMKALRLISTISISPVSFLAHLSRRTSLSRSLINILPPSRTKTFPNSPITSSRNSATNIWIGQPRLGITITMSPVCSITLSRWPI